MSERPGLEIAPQTPRSPILPSMPHLVVFIMSMLTTLIRHLPRKCKPCKFDRHPVSGGLMGKRGEWPWPPHPLDLTECDFFL